VKIGYWNVCDHAKAEAIIENSINIVESEDIDVLCLQEVPYYPGTTTPVSNEIAKNLGMDNRFIHTRSLGRTRGYGTAILSNSNLLDFSVKDLRTDAFAYMTPGKGNRRVLLSARTENDPDLNFAVAHLSYRLPLGIGQAGLMLERTKLFSRLYDLKRERPLIYGGDMNCEEESLLDGQLEFMGLVPIKFAVNTFRSRHFYAGYAQRNFDRAFHSAGLEVTPKLGDFRQSDHRWMVLDVH
jgi:endonuclease/exonuclease/phosphatase family metal-dependent hydrolase